MMPKEFLDIPTGFKFSKLQFGRVPSIPVAALGLHNSSKLMKIKSPNLEPT